MKPVINLCIDSGAFSAFTQKKAIKIDEYCDFLLKEKEHIGHAVCLDMINPEDPEVAAAQGWKNFLHMRDRGIESMPVFHARENFKWLDNMLDNVPYIGLSGTSLVSPTEHKHWYRLAWQYVTDKDGFPIADFHAFGDTAAESLLTYPWRSADSATWMIQGGRAARIRLQNKSYQFRSSSIRDTSYIDEADAAPKKEAWEDEIRSLGLDPRLIMSVKATQSELAMIRSYLLAAALLNLQEQTRPITKYKAPASLIGKSRHGVVGKEREGPCRCFFVISPAAYYFNLPIIASLGITNILCSYYYIDTAPKKFWPERLVPFLYNPVEHCQNDSKLKRFWDKIQEVKYKIPQFTIGEPNVAKAAV